MLPKVNFKKCGNFFATCSRFYQYILKSKIRPCVSLNLIKNFIKVFFERLYWKYGCCCCYVMQLYVQSYLLFVRLSCFTQLHTFYEHAWYMARAFKNLAIWVEQLVKTAQLKKVRTQFDWHLVYELKNTVDRRSFHFRSTCALS